MRTGVAGAHWNCRFEAGRGSLGHSATRPFPFPAHHTGRADFLYPAFRQTSKAHGGSARLNAGESVNVEFSEYGRPGETARIVSADLVPLGEEAPDTGVSVTVDGPIDRAVLLISSRHAHRIVSCRLARQWSGGGRLPGHDQLEYASELRQ